MNYTPEFKADVTSLDEDLQALRRSKYDSKTAEEVKQWIFTILQEPAPVGDLVELVKDGTVLCALANKLGGNIKFKASKMPFVQMENISQFLTFAAGYGVPQDELFQTIDIYEDKDPAQLLTTMKSFSRQVNKKNPSLPVIGPQLATKRTPPPVPAKKLPPGWSAMEYGYMKGANQATEGVVFGAKRYIV